ncbi:MAG: PLP-dependent aminotransferase family protein [Bacteroidota bacterium]|uniref:PLP-dependent aminotransferase family protein n=1 Tax=Flagellimonas profundi TaxID=2915620 RepID=A0ABS3FF75_9FLAO|nr:PLP-dependent aminotransferase family protein [Allomuricauda profundi]MBO0341822.1 PLP-dependent aminotransferase family protein [Allomuricauda profundi]MEC7770553.1 PLP-dependent aminotransferase family protein [Bacteroidota bacterium]
MNSPVFDLLVQLVSIDKSIVQPVYVQVAQQIMNAIQRGYLEKGSKLPGTRVLSELLNVHRNTAVAIYDELASQGWVNIIPNKGTFVVVPEDSDIKIKASTQHINQAYEYPKSPGFPFQQSFNLASTKEETSSKHAISDGKPDLRLHPVHQFSRWYSAAMKRKSLINKWNRTSASIPSVFSTQLCNYLNATRGFHINPTNLLNTRSTEMSLYIVSQVLIDPGDLVLVGQLSNYVANMIFQQAGAKIKTVPLDEEGLDIGYINEHFIHKNIRCIYVCSNRDYPTTITLSTKRRLQLLQLAKTHGFAIIEDDYDHDFQFEGSSMLPMASADADGNVIYLGKLGQSLFPSFHTGFVVATEQVITEAKNYLQLLDTQGDLIQEQMLSELISEGEIYRLKKKNIVTYKQRRDALSTLLKQHFANILDWQIPSGGLAMWLQFKNPVSLVKLAEKAEQLDLFLPKTILYQDKKTCAIRFGYGHLNKEELQIVMEKLKQAYLQVIAV